MKKKHKMWNKLLVVLNNSEKHNAITTIEEGTTSESQYYLAKNLGQQRGSSVTLNCNR
jgi:hypothetical protein